MRSTKPKYTEKDGVRILNVGYRQKPSTVKALQDYKSEYVRENYRQIVIKINKNRDGDVIKWIESHENATEYIRDLIRRDMLEKLGADPYAPLSGETEESADTEWQPSEDSEGEEAMQGEEWYPSESE